MDYPTYAGIYTGQKTTFGNSEFRWDGQEWEHMSWIFFSSAEEQPTAEPKSKNKYLPWILTILLLGAVLFFYFKFKKRK